MATRLSPGFQNVGAGSEYDVQTGTSGGMRFLQNVGLANCQLSINRPDTGLTTGARIMLLKAGDILRLEDADRLKFFTSCDVSTLDERDVERLLGSPVGIAALSGESTDSFGGKGGVAAFVGPGLGTYGGKKK